MFDDDKIKNGKEAWEDIEENPVGCTVEGKRWKINVREGWEESKSDENKNKHSLAPCEGIAKFGHTLLV